MIENGYGLNVFHGVDAVMDEDVRKQGHLKHRVDASERCVSTDDDRETDFAQFMGEEKKEPLVFVSGEAAAREVRPVQLKKLPTARVFRLDRHGKHHLALVYKD